MLLNVCIRCYTPLVRSESEKGKSFSAMVARDYPTARYTVYECPACGLVEAKREER